ncbi:MAG: hypothetical protein J6V48_03125, partial [Clostridia bacterium]|nr:hypothetical protein [Clostridia bacterium]
TCLRGGYTLWSCDCGRCELRDILDASGHSQLYMAYTDKVGVPTSSSIVKLVSFCRVCHSFSETADMASNLRLYGISLAAVRHGADEIVFEYEGVSYPYTPAETDNHTHTVPDRPEGAMPVEPKDILSLPAVEVPDIGYLSSGLPSAMIMRDGSVVYFCWYKKGNSVSARVLTEYLQAEVGECVWGWAFDDIKRVWTFGVWYHPQSSTWYFRRLDYDSSIG